MKNFQVKQVPVPCIQKRLHLPALALYMLLLLMTTGAKLNAQCNCPYVVGTGSPSGVSTLSAAKILFPGIEAPGDACVKIIGQFNVDAGEIWDVRPVTLNAFALVFFANSASSLFVLDEGTLLASNKAVFLPCAPFGTWQGTYLQSGGTVRTNDARFINASTAGISIASNAIFDIQNSKFVDCNDGLRIAGNQNPTDHIILNNEFYNCQIGIELLSAFDINILDNLYRYTFLTDTTVQKYTGIHLQGFCENITVTGGNFDSLARGIDAVKTINFTVSGANFKTCKSGIFCTQGIDKLWINNCVFNSTKEIGIHINYHDFIASPMTNLQMDNNQFLNHGTSSNMYIRNVAGPGMCAITNNQIDMPQPGPSPWPFASNGIEINRFYATGGLSIANNNLVSNNAGTPAPGGIFVQRANQAVTIDANHVSAISGGAISTHIRSADCSAAMNMYGNTTDGGALISNKGISVENCSGLLTLCCNTLSNSNTGLYITGPLNGAEIATTTFGDHPFAALHYDQVVSSGAPQINKGNDWSGASGTWDARFDGAAGVAAVTNYVVSNALLPNGLSKVFCLPAPNIWFQVNAATEPDCNTAGSCAGSPGGEQGGRDRAANQQIATNGFQVFPNPADEFCTMTFSGSDSAARITLLDAAGRVVMHEVVPAGNNQIQLPTAQLPQGFYSLELNQDGRPAQRTKILVAH